MLNLEKMATMQTRAHLALVLGALTLTSCRTAAEPPPPPHASLPAPELAQDHPMPAPESNTHTVFDLDGRNLTLHQKDAQQIRELLVARIEAQELEHRDKLLARTRGGDIELSPDRVRIGSWYLQVAGSALEAMIRLGAGNAPAYATKIDLKDGAWTVAEINAMHIHPAR